MGKKIGAVIVGAVVVVWLAFTEDSALPLGETRTVVVRSDPRPL